MEMLGRLAKLGVEGLYNYLSRLDRESQVTLLNYGYDGDDARLAIDGCSERYRLQLYHRVASSTDMSGKDVLEVGAGRGGGAAYLARCFGPRSYHAVDLSGEAVGFCRRHHRVPGLVFSRQDAENLDIGDAAVDVVVNIESSHNYPHPDRFFLHVNRVLKPGGSFLYADLRSSKRMEGLLSLLNEAGFEILRNENIAPGVVSALDKDNDEKLELLRRNVPRVLLGPMEAFAGLRGTPVYSRLKSGETAYFNMSLRKENR